MELNTDNSNQASIQPTDVMELGALVNIIVDYYVFKKNSMENEEGEKWKEKDFAVPPQVDELIEKSFITQLRKLTK